MDILLAYTSTARQLPTRSDLLTLLARARKKNAALDISGMLLHIDGAFFQVLEGLPDSVEMLFQVISKDPRHANVARVISEPIEQRSFREWSMGLSDASQKEVACIPGLNDFFQRGSSLAELGSGRAKSLLQAFQSGSWRRSIT